jgi:NADH:ubiquinone oxidoreductase subunit 6 (subunit J)
LKKTLKSVLTEYGAVALVLYLAIFALVLGGVYFALKAGWTPASATGKASTFVAAYIITKLTQPLRIAATVILTPLVARIYERIAGKKPIN